MKINRSTFVAILEKMAPMLGSNPLMPELQYFQIEGNHIQATNGIILADLICSIDTGLCCSISKEVLDLLISLSAEEVDLQVKENELKIKTNKIVGKFFVITPPTFQSTPFADNEERVSIDPLLLSDVVEALGFCRFGVSKDIVAGPYCGVQLNKDTIFSTDRYRVTKWELKEDSGITCTIPVKFIDLLKRYQRDIVSLSAVGDNILMAILEDGMCITTCLIPGKYPELLQYFSSSNTYEQIEFGDKLTSIIERHSTLLGDINPLDRIMLIEIEGGVCTLTSKVPEKANLVEQIDVKVREDLKLAFSVNPTFLREIASKCSSFKFYADGLILFEAEKLQYLMRTGGAD